MSGRPIVVSAMPPSEAERKSTSTPGKKLQDIAQVRVVRAVSGTGNSERNRTCEEPAMVNKSSIRSDVSPRDFFRNFSDHLKSGKEKPEQTKAAILSPEPREEENTNENWE